MGIAMLWQMPGHRIRYISALSKALSGSIAMRKKAQRKSLARYCSGYIAASADIASAYKLMLFECLHGKHILCRARVLL